MIDRYAHRNTRRVYYVYCQYCIHSWTHWTFFTVNQFVIVTHPYEKWIEKFAENIGMCSVCVFCVDYFGDQMVINMTHIVKVRRVYINFKCLYHCIIRTFPCCLQNCQPSVNTRKGCVISRVLKGVVCLGVVQAEKSRRAHHFGTLPPMALFFALFLEMVISAYR